MDDSTILMSNNVLWMKIRLSISHYKLLIRYRESINAWSDKFKGTIVNICF